MQELCVSPDLWRLRECIKPSGKIVVCMKIGTFRKNSANLALLPLVAYPQIRTLLF